MKVKEESEKVGLKLNIQKTKIMASSPITSWQIDGETVETVSDFIFLGSKITADVDCSHEIKGHLLLGRKVMTNLDSIFKSRDITLPTKVRLVKAMVFPVVMYRCESWTVKKAERWRIGAFKLWCWRRLLRVPWTARTSNQSILKEISPEWTPGVGDGQGGLACCDSWGRKESDTTERLNWTELKGETKRDLTQVVRRLCDHRARDESDGTTSQEAGRWKKWC